MKTIDEIYNEVIENSQENVKALGKKLEELNQLHKDIIKLKEDNNKLPQVFADTFEQIANLSQKYTDELGKTTHNYLKDNNLLFTSKIAQLSDKIKEINKEVTRLKQTDYHTLFRKLQETFIKKTREDLTPELAKFSNKARDLQEKINNLNVEVDRLVKTDFNVLFADLQEEFIKITRADLKPELDKFDTKARDLQGKIDSLNIEVDRLQGIDLEKHFDKLQKTLSDIFGAINSLNSSFTTIIQTLNTVVQEFGNNHKEIQDKLEEVSKNTSEQLKEQGEEIKKSNELFDTQLKALTEQNNLLKKEVKTNRVILFIGFGILVIASLYPIFIQ
jgi:methyl-accepting chemotaxis protein